ncbi:LPS assembly protein LptD [Idiomarina sp.]|uniref:LPS-assembly protein LptD n=1 Tax=Idiomarina sp. TaxID=1874361 RepID=UPI0025B7F7F5|nr:LPS assembly protein LptD [Idiomarina sp.]NQZ05285.1 LPS assembly protein LptD [Idiomarina sp.]
MPLRYKVAKASAVLFTLFSASVSAQQALTSVCSARYSQWSFEEPKFDVSEQLPGSILVHSDNSNVSNNGEALFTGNVSIRQDGQWLLTESARINQEKQTIDANQGVLFSDGYIQVKGNSFNYNGVSSTAELRDTEYRMKSTQARGQAQLLRLSEQHVNLFSSSFTTCPTDDPAWKLTADRIEISQDEDFGEAWGAKVELFDIPVIYLPYFTFPVNDKRKTGFLYPTIDTSSINGLEVEVPYYFNIAPNMDATLAPVYISKRGTMLKSEYRFLTDNYGGQINLEYLQNDSLRLDNADRYLWHIDQQAQFGDHWRAYVNATQISDDNYLNDFGSDFAGRADTHLYRVAQVDYLNDNFFARIRTEDYELLGQYQSPFRTLPQLSMRYDQGSYTGINWAVESELTYFQNQDDANQYATRAHLEPSLSYSVEAPAYDGEAEFSYLYTHYRQERPSTELSDSVSRSLPRARLRGRLHLERFFDGDDGSYRQTLVPQVQYLYVPYEDQSDIGIYDTTLMQDDYYGLFRAQRYSGLDRIAEANQITYGATTSIFDQRERELLRFAFGQIYYFDESRTELLEQNTARTSSNTEWVADLTWAITPNWSVKSAIQYDTELNQTRKSQTAVEYRFDNKNLVQINHRKATNILNSDIEQVGAQAVWEINNQWQVAANVYYDLVNSRTNDAILGVQYSSCCWALRVSAYRRINLNLEPAMAGTANAGMMQNTFAAPEFDNGVSLQFIISGLSSDGSSLIEMLEKSIYGYRRPFYLSN